MVGFKNQPIEGENYNYKAYWIKPEGLKQLLKNGYSVNSYLFPDGNDKSSEKCWLCQEPLKPFQKITFLDDLCVFAHSSCVERSEIKANQLQCDTALPSNPEQSQEMKSDTYDAARKKQPIFSTTTDEGTKIDIGIDDELKLSFMIVDPDGKENSSELELDALIRYAATLGVQIGKMMNTDLIQEKDVIEKASPDIDESKDPDDLKNEETDNTSN